MQSGSSVDIVIASLPVEGDGEPAPQHRVTGMDPEPEKGARVGQEIAVIGENFVTPLYRNRVSFDDEVVLPRSGGATRLRVIVPELTGIPKSVRVCVEVDGVSKCLPELYPISEGVERTGIDYKCDRAFRPCYHWFSFFFNWNRVRSGL